MWTENLAEFVKERVSKCYWELDENCATATLNILSEVFEIELNSQTVDAALGMHGAGKYGAQCGLVEGTLMFLGIFGRQNNMQDEIIIDVCRDFAKQFEDKFNSLQCRVLRPQGFNSDNSLHLCERLKCQEVEFAIKYISR